MLLAAGEAYERAGLLGSPLKDIVDEERACIMGAEIDASSTTRALGLVTIAAPSGREPSGSTS